MQTRKIKDKEHVTTEIFEVRHAIVVKINVKRNSRIFPNANTMHTPGKVFNDFIQFRKC